MYDSIIFDMDGTLIDNLKPMVKSWNLTFKKHGWNKITNYEEMKSVMGLNGHDIGVKLFPYIDEVEAENRVIISSIEEVDYFRSIEIGTTYIPNEEFLINLSKKYKLFIVSNCLEGYIEVFLEKFNFEKYFIDIQNAANKLSKAQNISNIVKRNNLKNPVYIGDTIKDFESAKEAKVDFIFAAYGFGNVKCEKSINSLLELENIMN